MSILIYSTCRIEFTPKNKELPERNYSDRSVIEIRQYENNTDYSLRAIDIQNNKTEIFNFPIKDPKQYEFGDLDDDDEPDEINGLNGTYRLWLHEDSRRLFHDTFSTICELLFPNKRSEISSEILDPSSISMVTDTTNNLSRPDPINCDPKNILTDIRNLSRFIKQGNSDGAARMARQLVSQGIRLKATSELQNEEEFQIFVQFDGNEYGIDQNGGTIPINVFPSTTVRELRAAFEIAYHYSPTSQYFFVNGNLVDDNSTMRDLNVGPSSLFVLFLIVYPKQFTSNGPWNCSTCLAQNQQDNLKCRLCSASRIE